MHQMIETIQLSGPLRAARTLKRAKNFREGQNINYSRHSRKTWVKPSMLLHNRFCSACFFWVLSKSQKYIVETPETKGQAVPSVSTKTKPAAIVLKEKKKTQRRGRLLTSETGRTTDRYYLYLLMWEPYPSHHNGIFSPLLVRRDFAARGYPKQNETYYFFYVTIFLVQYNLFTYYLCLRFH